MVLQRTRFVPLQGTLDDYHLYMLLAPHLGNRGAGNTAWVGDYKGIPMLFAEREGEAPLASSRGKIQNATPQANCTIQPISSRCTYVKRSVHSQGSSDRPLFSSSSPPTV
jgi:hypothetical protein